MNTIVWQWIGFCLFSCIFCLMITPNIKRDIKHDKTEENSEKVRSNNVSDLLMLVFLGMAVWLFVILPIFPNIKGSVLRIVIGVVFECIIPSVFLAFDHMIEALKTRV